MSVSIAGARLIDGTGAAPIDRAVVVIEGRRIKEVGPEGEVALPGTDTTVIDAGGRTLLPGLMDLHAAIAGLTHAEQPYGITEKTVASTMLRGVRNGRRCLDVGVTTLRVDTCGHHGIFALKDAFAEGVVDGPRLFVPGRALCITGGHGWNYRNHEADGADAMRAAAREELKAGADWVKLMVTGGAGSPTERIEDNQMTFEEIKAAVEEAHKKGKYAFAHLSCAEGIRNCIKAGIDSVEHGIYLEEDCARDMKEKGVFLVPTLGVYRRLVERGEMGEVPEYMYRKSLQVVERHAQSFRMALEAGVKIATGTDSGQIWFPLGQSLLTEMEIMNEEGMSTTEVVKSATSRAAELLRVSDDLGSVEQGKLADLLIVDGNPLTNMSDIRKTWMVFKEGHLVFRK